MQRWAGTAYLSANVPSGQIIATLITPHNSTEYGTAIPSAGIFDGRLICSYHLNGAFICYQNDNRISNWQML